MKPLYLAAALAALCTPAAAAPPDGPAAADPGAAVPRMAYRSVFQDTPTGVEPDAIDWKKANADVGQFPRGHIDLLKWEETQGRSPAAPGPAAAASGPANPPTPPGHKH